MVHSDPSSRRWTAHVLLACFLLSGAAGLMYEVIWARMLGQVFGSSIEAIATTVAAFMAGFALGGLVLGRLSIRLRSPLHAYVVLELCIAGLGLLLTFLLPRMGGISGWLGASLADAREIQVLVRVALVLALVAVPSALMGGTLPLMVAHLTRTGGPAGRPISLCYAANTLGAVVGCLLPDFLLVPLLGLLGTVGVAASLNLVAAGVAYRFGGGRKRPGLEQPTPSVGVSPRSSRARLVLVVIALSGFAAMGYEVLWSRLNIALCTSHVFSFSVTLAVYLTGLALGSALAAWRIDGVANRMALLGHLELWVGVLVLASISWLLWTGPARASIIDVVEGALTEESPTVAVRVAATMVGNLFSAAAMVLLPTILLGITVPLAARLQCDAGVPAGLGIGRVYFWNTAAGIPGALLTGLLLVPRLGVQATMVVLASLSGLLGGITLLAAHRRHPRRLVIPGLVLLALLVSGGWLLPGRQLMEHIVTFLHGRYGEITLIREGQHQTMVLVEERFLEQTVKHRLCTDSYSMTARCWDAGRYMKLMAHVPVLLAEEPRRACLICFGLGSTLEGLCAYPQLEQIDVVDISPEVFEIYEQVVGGPGALADPRVRRVVEDGRMHLLATREQYDVITLEPPPPTMAGVVNLYSREFYEIARRRLRPGGTMCQWIPLGQVTAPEARAMMASFVAVFPHAALWHGVTLETAIVGRTDPLHISLDTLAERMGQPGVRDDLLSIGVRDMEEFLASMLLGPGELGLYCDGSRPVTDHHPLLPHSTSMWDRGLIDGTLYATDANLAVLLRPRATWRQEDLDAFAARLSARRELLQEAHRRMMFLQQDPPSVLIARCDILFADLLAQDPGNLLLEWMVSLDPVRTLIAEERLAGDPGNGIALIYLSRLALYRGQHRRALALLERAQASPAVARAGQLYLQARVLAELGEHERAHAAYDEALTLEQHPVFVEIIKRQRARLSPR